MKALPEGIRTNKEAVAETIENNVRKLIIDEHADQPEVLRADVGAARRADRAAQGGRPRVPGVSGEDRRTDPADAAVPSAGAYPRRSTPPAKRALYDNLGRDEALALQVDQAVRTSLQDGWRSNTMKTKRVRQAIAAALPGRDGDGNGDDARIEATLELVKNQNDY